MGLYQVSSVSPFSFLKWRLPAFILLASLLFELSGTAGRLVLRFDRADIESFELWRLLTGHLVHLGWSHFLLNAAGLVLVWLLVAGSYSEKHWIALMLLSIAGIDAGLWFLDPDLRWYVGFSGALHGMLMAAVIAEARNGSVEAVVLGIVLIGKIAWEQFMGPLPGSTEVAGGSVVVNAHLYGAISGGLAAMALHRVRRHPPI